MTAIAVLSLMPVSGAEAGVLAGGASEFTQMLNKVELIVQTQKMAQQVMQAKKTVELLKNNFERLGSGGWAMYAGALNTLADSVTHGERTAFALAQADEAFNPITCNFNLSKICICFNSPKFPFVISA